VPCSGNSSHIIHYQATDPLPVAQGLSYYRLDQYDINGTMTSYPAMVHVPCKMDVALMAWPNPVVDQLYMSLTSSIDPNETVRAKVLDMSGREVADHAVNIAGGSIGGLSGLSVLRAGPYLVRLYSSKRGFIGNLQMVRM